MKKPSHYTFVPIDKDRIIKQIYLDKDTLVTCNVVSETKTKYICYSAYGGKTFSVKKINAYEDKEELQYIRWARNVNKKTRQEIQKLLHITTRLEYKKRYIDEYPEKLI